MTSRRSRIPSVGQVAWAGSVALACLSSGVQCWFDPGSRGPVPPLSSVPFRQDEAAPLSPRQQTVQGLLWGMASCRELALGRPGGLVPISTSPLGWRRDWRLEPHDPQVELTVSSFPAVAPCSCSETPGTPGQSHKGFVFSVPASLVGCVYKGRRQLLSGSCWAKLPSLLT